MGWETPCWIWWNVKPGNYGFTQGVRSRLAHRVFYEEAFGEEIPIGYNVHHKCQQPACVNPAHLVAVTQGDHLILHGIVGPPKPSNAPSFKELAAELGLVNGRLNLKRRAKSKWGEKLKKLGIDA